MRSNMRFIGVTKDATTAGPGLRLELFLKGCIRGIVNPCQGCFNPTTWEFGGDRKEMSVDEVVSLIKCDAWNRQVTFCGGEPLLQTRNLIEVCKALKESDPKFHIVVYTAYTLENLMNNGIRFSMRPQDGEDVRETLLAYSDAWDLDERNFTIATPSMIRELMTHIDLLVDGDYQHDKRLPTDQFMNEGMFIGSWNQRVIDAPQTARTDLIIYSRADHYNEKMARGKSCKCCGHSLYDFRKSYCDSWCRKTYALRQQQLKKMGM